MASSDYEQPISTNNILSKMWPILSAFVANRLKRAVEIRLKKHQPATVRTPRVNDSWAQRGPCSYKNLGTCDLPYDVRVWSVGALVGAARGFNG